MTTRFTGSLVSSFAAITLVAGCAQNATMAPKAAPAATSPMSFFLTSANPGKGADLGGLAGADAYCGKLAASAGAGSKTWRAYLAPRVLTQSTRVTVLATAHGLTPRENW